MVKLFHIAVLFKHPTKAVMLCAASDLTSFGFFQRNSVQEFMNFTSQVLSDRSQPGTRTSVKAESYMCHVYVRGDKLCGALISDHEYPHRVAHTLLSKVLDDFAAKVPPHQWQSEAMTVSFPELQESLTRYQNVKEADALTKIQAELDETKVILHNTIESVLERGEKLEDLVAKSDDLSMQSKAFYKTARKTNSCCVLL